MPDSDVHAIACGPYLRLHLVAPRANRSHDLFFEGALGVEGTFTQFDRQSRRPPGGVVEVALQMARALPGDCGPIWLRPLPVVTPHAHLRCRTSPTSRP